MAPHHCERIRSGFGVVILRHVTLLSALGLGSSVFACTSDVFTTTSQAGGAGAAGEGGAGSGGGGQGGGGEGGAPIKVCDDQGRTNDSIGVFVAVDGDDTLGDGSRAKPFASPRRAFEAAQEKGKSAIYVGRGAYEIAETLHVGPESPIVELSGGWSKDCSSSTRDETILQGAIGAGATVLVETAREFRLSGLTVKTKGKATPASIGAGGNSLYGVWLKSTSKVSLSDLVAMAGDGGDGGFASKGADATEGSSCGGINDCSTGANASTLGEDGKASTAIVVDGNGYQPSNGENGGIGAVGGNGTPGKAGSSHEDCQICHPDCDVTVETIAAGKGTCGCGGLGGEGGLGGRGGGASIALLVGAGTVDIKNSSFGSSSGGAGSIGGDGGLGASGQDGKVGAGVQCVTFAPGGSCFKSNPADICRFSSSVTSVGVPGGAAGGKGGRGGVGGRGGPGAGGPSYGIVTVGAASVEIGPGVVFDIGRGGQGAPGAPNGDSAERKAF